MIYMLCFTSRKINYLSYINKLLLICIVVLLTTFLTVKCSLPHSSVTEINLPETSTSVYNITLNSFFNFKHPTTKYLLPSAPPNNTLSWPRPFILNPSNTILHQISTNITCQSEISKKNDDLATARTTTSLNTTRTTISPKTTKSTNPPDPIGISKNDLHEIDLERPPMHCFATTIVLHPHSGIELKLHLGISITDLGILERVTLSIEKINKRVF